MTRLREALADSGGLTEAHRLSDDEIGRGRVERGVDLPLVRRMGGGALTSGGRLSPDKDVDGAGWTVPAGLLEDADSGAVLILHHTAEGMRPEVRPGLEPPADLAERAERVGELARELRDDDLVVEVDALAVEVAVRSHEVLDAPVPFGELLAEADLTVCDGCVLLPDEEPESWRLERERALVDPAGSYDPEVVELVSRLRLARQTVRRGGELAAGDARQLDGGLYEAPALELAVVHLLGIEGDPDGSVRRLLDAIVERLDRRPGPGVHVLRARLAEFDGDTGRQVAGIDAALSRSGDFAPALEDHAWNLEDRGDVAGAVSALRRAGISPPDPQLERLLELQHPEFADTGRNDPCPCGSGRKFKQCHLRAEGRSLDDRVDWLLAKALAFLDRPAQRRTVLEHLEVFAEATEEGLQAAMRDPIVAGLLLFDHGLVGEFVQVRGALLPDDERDLAARWAAETTLELLELTDRTDHRVTAHALVADEEVVLTGDRDPELVAEVPVGEVVGTHLVSAPSGPRVALACLHVPTPLVDEAAGAVRSGDADTISAWYAGEIARRAEAGPRHDDGP